MTKYIIKPGVTFEAFQFEKDCEFPDWVDFTIIRRISDPSGNVYKLEIHDSDGIINAYWGDWIIKGSFNEIQVRKSQSFEAMYKKVD